MEWVAIGFITGFIIMTGITLIINIKERRN